MIYFTRMLNNFNYAIAKNPNYENLLLRNYKTITNTSCVIVWHNPIKNDFHYLIQKRSERMKRGKGNLAIGGGMLEKYDMSLQYGAVREIMEESQVKFKKAHLNMTHKTIKQLCKNLFYLSHDQSNFTFYLILSSNKMPRWNGPIKINKYPFNNSQREIDLDDTMWNNNKLKNRIYKGHCFMTSNEIKKHYTKEPKIWKYSKQSLSKLFDILEN